MGNTPNGVDVPLNNWILCWPQQPKMQAYGSTKCAPRTDLFTGLRRESNPLLGLQRRSIVSDRMVNMLVHVMDNPLAGQQNGNVEITLPKFHYLNK